MTITPEMLTEWKRLAEKATPGPWKLWDAWKGKQPIVHVRRIGPYGNIYSGIIGDSGEDLEGPEADFEFIAVARTALPLLCAEVERLRAQMELARKMFFPHGWTWDNDFPLEAPDA